jgi:hypothetical protein
MWLPKLPHGINDLINDVILRACTAVRHDNSKCVSRRRRAPTQTATSGVIHCAVVASTYPESALVQLLVVEAHMLQCEAGSCQLGCRSAQCAAAATVNEAAASHNALKGFNLVCGDAVWLPCCHTTWATSGYCIHPQWEDRSPIEKLLQPQLTQ